MNEGGKRSTKIGRRRWVICEHCPNDTFSCLEIQCFVTVADSYPSVLRVVKERKNDDDDEEVQQQQRHETFAEIDLFIYTVEF